MPTRGRQRYLEIVSDDEEDGSYYEPLHYPAPAKRSSSRLRFEVNRDPARSPARRERVYHANSFAAPEPENIIIENNLAVPQLVRPRASSTGARPAPNLIYVQQPVSRDPSRERHKHYHRRYEYSESDSDTSSHRRRHRKKSGETMDAEMMKKFAKLELLEDESRRKTEKQREETLLLEYKEKMRKQEEAEEAAIAQAEARRLKKEAERKAEQERLILLEKEKASLEKAERMRIIAEEKQRMEREKKEAERERERIILEEELKKKKAKEEHEALRLRILAEEEERVAKEKAKKKKEEEEFQQKVKERFMKAGYSPQYIEDILEEKKKSSLERRTSQRSRAHDLQLDISRPTYIRVKIEHLYPETLEYFHLPWDYDPTDDRYLLIKKYVSHELQQELFEHTRKIKIKRQDLLITDGYVKDTVTTLKPRDVFKDKDTDEMFLVRKKSVSKSPARRSWMFT